MVVPSRQHHGVRDGVRVGAARPDGTPRRRGWLAVIGGGLTPMVVVLMVTLGCVATRRSSLTPDQVQLNVASFDVVWETVRDKHWDPDLGGVDWEAMYTVYRPRMEDARAMGEARMVIREMLGELQQSHFRIIPRHVYDPTLEDFTSEEQVDGEAGFEIVVVDEQVVVSAVWDDFPAAAAGIRPGWAVLKIDGEAVPPLLRRARETYADSGYQEIMTHGAVHSRLAGPSGARRELTFLDGADHTVTRSVTLAPRRGIRARFGALPLGYAWLESDLLDGDIGYIRLSLFAEPVVLMPQFGEAVESCLQCSGMIIDLRGNPGGMMPMAAGIAGWFIDQPDQYLGTMYMREGYFKLGVFPRLRTFQGPVAVLVDGRSASTSEILACGLKDLDRARLFGAPTAGLALVSAPLELPNGDRLQYAFANYVSRGGRVLEGNGVVPDEMVAVTRQALLMGHDPVVERASSWILQQRDAGRS